MVECSANRWEVLVQIQSIDYFKYMLYRLKNLLSNKYAFHPEAVIVSCFFNPKGSVHRAEAFEKFYDSIKHLNYRIVECIIGNTPRELPRNDPNISVVYTDSLLWHKESLLNNLIATLPKKFKYVFWVDADVLFSNKNWLVDGVKQLKKVKIIQPFEYCVHLEENETEPSKEIFKFLEFSRQCGSFDFDKYLNVWRSFCANCTDDTIVAQSVDYNTHGHVGFAWGARREVLDAVPLYDKALIGGADHIIAHAANGQINHPCITKAFFDDIEAVNNWSVKFNNVVGKSIGYVKGNLYHIWHGDIKKREYLKRIKEFTGKSKDILNKDSNGLYISKRPEQKEYMDSYFNRREVKKKKIVQPINNNRTRNNYSADDCPCCETPVVQDTYCQEDTRHVNTHDNTFAKVVAGTIVGNYVADKLMGSSHSTNQVDTPEIEKSHEVRYNSVDNEAREGCNVNSESPDVKAEVTSEKDFETFS